MYGLLEQNVVEIQLLKIAYKVVHLQYVSDCAAFTHKNKCFIYLQ